MRKIWLNASLFFLLAASAAAQTLPADSTGFVPRKLKVTEVNLVGSYYSQDGENSAVTGGIGTEELTDLSTVLSINLARSDRKGRLHTYRFDGGIDHYTSASSDKIDPTTISSASSADNRFYPSLSWAMVNEQKRFGIGAGVSVSTEYDYLSTGGNVSFSRFSKDHNRDLTLGLSAYLDTWTIIYPIELRDIQTPVGPVPNPDAHGTKPRNSYNASFTFSQVVNKRMQFSVLLDLAYQSGQLATPYQRVYFTDNSLQVEKLPDTRIKVPVGVRFNYFATDRILLRSFYRFYADDWGITAQTAELEVPVKITPFISVSPFYRFYSQTSADYFAPYREHSPAEEFYTSDYDLSDFTSHMQGLNLRFNSADGILGIKKLNTIELRYSHYSRSNSLVANSITAALTVK